MCPWWMVRSELRMEGIIPAQAHSLRAVANRVMSPISDTKVIALRRPMPGMAMRASTRLSGLAWRRIWPRQLDPGLEDLDQDLAVGDHPAVHGREVEGF